MPPLRPYHVAIVGSGPSGYFAAASLLKAAGDGDDTAERDVRVDMLEMLPTPWGLVRSGVAPDHPKIKSISAQFDKTAADPRFRFFGNIAIGEHVHPAELAERYDAVIYAVGAQSDRPLGIPGEDLPGSVAAVDFVGWYNAHPHFGEMTPDISQGRAVVVGNGNVAIDVARILVSDPEMLAATDIADHALQSLHTRGVEEVLIIGRRGPLQAPFTTLELRELGDLDALGDVDVIVDPADLADITDDDLEAAGKTVRNNIKVLRGYAERGPRGAKRRIVFRFRTSPIEIKGDGKVESIVLGRNELVSGADGRVTAKDTGEREEVPAQLVVRAVGYRGLPMPGLPFDERAGTIPHVDGEGPGQPQRLRRRLDQAGSHRGDRQQQEGLPGHGQHAAAGPGLGRARRLRRRSRPAGAAVDARTAAQTRDGRPLEAHRRARAHRRRGLGPAPGQGDQPGRTATDRARVTRTSTSRGCAAST